MAELMFHGAAGEVTGSMHMVRMDGNWIALDCGLYQGRRSETEEKNRKWPIEPKDISTVILSHGHIDHTGRLPRLVRDGFDGDIFCTPATRDLCSLMLADSAHIQEEDAKYINKKNRKRGKPLVEPLYEAEDAVNTMKLMISVPHDRWFHVNSGVRACFHEAGHMLGSAGVRLAFGKREDHNASLYYTGDVGRMEKPILRDPRPFPPSENIICESTYGGRVTPIVRDAEEQLFQVVKRTIDRGGKVVIPAFSVGRTQTIVYFIQGWMDEGRLDCIPVYVDSPLAVNATEIFRMHPELYDKEAREMQQRTGEFLKNECVRYIRKVEDSKALNHDDRPCVIISASGMCEAGRIRHHLKNNIRKSRNTILIPGYQAAHTLGRRLADGEPEVRMFGKEYEVKAEVVQLSGFSAHADEADLLRMAQEVQGKTKRFFLTHGEEEARQALKPKLAKLGFEVEAPMPGDKFDI